jgi:hypothetical protein
MPPLTPKLRSSRAAFPLSLNARRGQGVRAPAGCVENRCGSDVESTWVFPRRRRAVDEVEKSRLLHSASHTPAEGGKLSGHSGMREPESCLPRFHTLYNYYYSSYMMCR